MYTVIRTVTERFPVRSLASLTNRYTFSTTPVHNGTIQFKNHDDFVKKVFVNNDLPVIMDFHAEWWGPCKKLTETLVEKIEPLNDLILVIVKVEENIDIVHTFEVKAVPAILAVRNGLVVAKYIGLVNPYIIAGLVEHMSQSQATA